MQIGVWERKKNTDPIRLSGPGGEPMEISPGRTWVQLVDADNHTLDYGVSTPHIWGTIVPTATSGHGSSRLPPRIAPRSTWAAVVTTR